MNGKLDSNCTWLLAGLYLSPGLLRMASIWRWLKLETPMALTKPASTSSSIAWNKIHQLCTKNLIATSCSSYCSRKTRLQEKWTDDAVTVFRDCWTNLPCVQEVGVVAYELFIAVHWEIVIASLFDGREITLRHYSNIKIVPKLLCQSQPEQDTSSSGRFQHHNYQPFKGVFPHINHPRLKKNDTCIITVAKSQSDLQY